MNKLGAHDSLAIGATRLNAGDPLPDGRFVQSFIEALLQAEHLNLLVGSGLTTALIHATGSDHTAGMDWRIGTGDDDLDERLEHAAQRSAEASGRGSFPNAEDRLRVALAAAAGLEVIADARSEQITDGATVLVDQLRTAIAQAESIIGTATSARPSELLSSFLSTFGGRAPTRDRLHLFTTNYDRVLEWGAEQSGLRIIDRFIGSLSPIFRSSRLDIDFHYSPPGSQQEPRHLEGVVRLTKLHGSLDWAWDANSRRVIRTPSEFGTAPTSSAAEVLIYPNSAKDSETTLYPYSDLFRDFSAAVCRPDSILVTYGYSFGDDHINRVIRDALTISSTHLLVISYGDEGGRIGRFFAEYELTGQVSLLIGPTFADLGELSRTWLPRPAASSLLRKQANILADPTPSPNVEVDGHGQAD